LAKRPSRQKGKRERTYSRLTKADRRSIEEGLDRNLSIRKIADEVGKSASTVHDEVMRHRFVTSPRARYGDPAPRDLEEVCARLGRWPRCCNGCKRRGGYGCPVRPKVYYRASMAQKAADSTLSEARLGVDEGEREFEEKVRVIRDCLSRGISPEQIVHIHPELGLSKSTIYGWIDRGYAGMSNMDLRRKVSYKPRHHSLPRRPARHSPRRSHDEFLRLPGDVRESAWEMDTVEGRKTDTQCLLTLYHRPSGLQLALPIRDQTSPSVLHGLGLVRDALGSEEAVRRVFSLVLTDNGGEFADEEALAHALGERDGECRLYYCDPRRADQKGGCERNHSEIRKLLPKGKGIKFDLLTRRDASLLMSEVNSEPRGKLAWLCPCDLFVQAFGEDAEHLLEAFGIERITPADLDLTPQCLERGRARRGEASLV
jgi:IS30 family transposase